MNNIELFEPLINDLKEMHINIEDARFTILTDRGIEKLGKDSEKETSLHFHMYYELFYITDGSLEIEFEEDSVNFKKDNIIIIRPKVPHKTVLKTSCSSRCNISFFIEKNHIETNHSLYDMLNDFFSDEYLFIENGSTAYDIIKKITKSIDYENHFIIFLYFYELIITLMRIAGYLKPNFSAKIFSDSSVSRTYKIQHIISTHYMDDISIEYIAKTLHLSTRQVSRIVQAFYGCTFREIITRTKIRSAADLLATSPMTISEISLKTGYHSLRGFYTAFKKYYDCLPTQYRKQNKR